MSAGADTLESPRGVVETLRRHYLESDHVSPEINLALLFERERDTLVYRQERLASWCRQLAAADGCDLALDHVDALAERPRTNSSLGVRIAYYESALAYAGVLVDVVSKYPDIERRNVTRQLNAALRAGLEEDTDLEQLLAAGRAVYRLAMQVARGHELLATIRGLRRSDTTEFAHPSDSYDRFRAVVEERIESGERERLDRLQQELAGTVDGAWQVSDLLRFDPIEFEQLLADLWEDYHNATRPTRARQDRGVDVIVRSPAGHRVLLQAKRYSPGNTVGIAAVQRVAGLLVEFPASTAAVVTSSSFTESAKTSARSMDEVHLVDGEQLCSWLTDSALCPPTLGTSPE